MRRRVFVILFLVLAVTACSSPAPARHAAAASTQPAAVASAQPSPEPSTAAALVRIAQVFNTDYDHNDDRPVWDRWDARGQAVISSAEYIRRHAECATAPTAPAYVESAAPGPNGTWIVHYEIGGQQLTDYLFYIHRRWEFDLILSNPDSARLYRLPFAKYAAQVGCQTH